MIGIMELTDVFARQFASANWRGNLSNIQLLFTKPIVRRGGSSFLQAGTRKDRRCEHSQQRFRLDKSLLTRRRDSFRGTRHSSLKKFWNLFEILLSNNIRFFNYFKFGEVNGNNGRKSYQNLRRAKSGR